MVKKSQRRTCMHLILVLCSGLLLIFEITIPKTMAYRKDGDTSKMKEYLVQDQRTHMTKQNYLVQHGVEGDMLGDNFDLVYPGTPPDYDRKSEELQALIVDYANMRRNNIILLDNSVETRTRKRGNIKVEEISEVEEVPIDRPCTCEIKKKPYELDINHYPRFLPQTGCSADLCLHPYKCEPTIYNHTVLKLKSSRDEPSEVVLPIGLDRRWIRVVVPLPVGCVCKSDFILPG